MTQAQRAPWQSGGSGSAGSGTSPTPEQQQLSLEQLRDTVEVQQRTIRFLLANWDALRRVFAAATAP